MKGIYYFVIFMIYSFSTKIMKEKKIPLFYTSVAITTLWMLHSLSLMYFLRGYKLIGRLPPTFVVFVVLLLIWGLNYWMIIKPKHFLRQGFKATIFKSILMIAYVLLSLYSVVLAASKNRERIQYERKIYNQVDPENDSTPSSLEERVRIWFEK